MFAFPAPLSRRIASIVALVAVGAALLVAAVLAQPAHSAGYNYPSAVKKAFMKACVKSALESADLSRAQATAYCSGTLTCVERRMSFGDFEAAVSKMQRGGSDANVRIVKSCEKSAAAQAG